MVRFLMLIRNGFNKHKVAFLSAFVLLIALLYFAPSAIFDTGGNGVLGLFISLLSFPDMLQYVESGEVSMFDVAFYRFFPLALFVIAVSGTCLAYKIKPFIMCSCPFGIYCIVAAAQNLHFSDYVPSWHAYASFYILFATLLVIATITLLLALCLPLKPQKPRPPREHKPTKAERIAELEARVRELENRD